MWNEIGFSWNENAIKRNEIKENRNNLRNYRFSAFGSAETETCVSPVNL